MLAALLIARELLMAVIATWALGVIFIVIGLFGPDAIDPRTFVRKYTRREDRPSWLSAALYQRSPRAYDAGNRVMAVLGGLAFIAAGIAALVAWHDV